MKFWITVLPTFNWSIVSTHDVCGKITRAFVGRTLSDSSLRPKNLSNFGLPNITQVIGGPHVDRLQQIDGENRCFFCCWKKSWPHLYKPLQETIKISILETHHFSNQRIGWCLDSAKAHDAKSRRSSCSKDPSCMLYFGHFWRENVVTKNGEVSGLKLNETFRIPT